MQRAEIESGLLFRNVTRTGKVGDSLTGQTVARIVQSCARQSDFDPKEFRGHSLRAGFVTSAAERGASAERSMNHTGHQSLAMVRVYTRRIDAFRDHPGEGLLQVARLRSRASVARAQAARSGAAGSGTVREKLACPEPLIEPS